MQPNSESTSLMMLNAVYTLVNTANLVINLNSIFSLLTYNIFFSPVNLPLYTHLPLLSLFQPPAKNPQPCPSSRISYPYSSSSSPPPLSQPPSPNALDSAGRQSTAKSTRTPTASATSTRSAATTGTSPARSSKPASKRPAPW